MDFTWCGSLSQAAGAQSYTMLKAHTYKSSNYNDPCVTSENYTVIIKKSSIQKQIQSPKILLIL